MIRHFFTLACLFILLIPSKGQVVLTLEEAVTIALEENLGIQWVEKSYEIAKVADDPGAAGMLPSVVLESQAEYAINNTDLTLISGESQSTTGAGDFGWRSTLRADWTLFDGFGKQIRKDRLELQEEQALLDYKAEAYRLTIDVATTYYQLVFLNKNLDLLKQDEDYYTDLLQLARQKDSLGTGTRIDILQAETDLNTLRTEIALQEKTLDAVYAALNRLLNRSLDRQPAIDTSFISQPSYAFERLRERALESNDALLQQEVVLQRAGKNLDLSRAAVYPVIDLFGSLSYNYSRSDGSFLLENQTYGPTAGLSLRFPIYDGNRIDREQEIARIEQEREVLRERDLEQDISEMLFDAFTQYNAYREQYRLETGNVALAEENFMLADEMYRFGSIDQFDLRQTRQQLLRAEQRRINASYQVLLQRLQLIYLTGEPLLEALD